MESYIVRIYRRSRNKPGEVAGLIETVGTDEKQAFQSFTGLVAAMKQAIVRNEKNAEFTATDDSITKQAG